MKNIILSIGLIIAIFSLSGCGGNLGPKITTNDGSEYYISNKGNNMYVVWAVGKASSFSMRMHPEQTSRINVKKKVLKMQLESAAKHTKKLGYNYFALTNVNVSNLHGFPINNYNDLIRYITLKERKEHYATDGSARDSEALVIGQRSNEIHLGFTPISNSVANSGAISVWKVSDFIR